MSIIHDALKKVQKSMQNNNQNPQNPETPPEEQVEVLPSTSDTAQEKKSSMKPVLMVFGALIVIVLSGVFLTSQLKTKYPDLFQGFHFKFSFNSFKKKEAPKPLAQIVIPAPVAHKSASTPGSKQKVQPQKETVKQGAVAKPSEPPSNPASSSASSATILNVQGVLSNNNHNVALINNNVYEEGSVVNGEKILKINLNAITVEHDGKEEVIPIKR